jgi:serine protease Do
VDLEGRVLGLNTFILSEGGGSEGLGFAIPARPLKFIYDQIRKHGRVRRLELQVVPQAITPALAEGLGLAQDWGVVLSDVAAGGPGESGGLRPMDIILEVDGRRITGLPGLSASLYIHPLEEPFRFTVLRGTQRLELAVPAIPKSSVVDSLADLAVPEGRNAHLGIFAANFSEGLAHLLPPVRIHSGVVVVALSPEPNALISDLQVGDVIHALNRTPILEVGQLRDEVRKLDPGAAAVLTVERQGKTLFLTLDTE